MQRRPRRNRNSAAIRNLTRETRLHPEQLIFPLFIIDGKNIKEEIKSLPGNFRMSLDFLLQEIENASELGIHSFILFPGVSESLKDNIASYSYAEDNFYLAAAQKIKTTFPNCHLISDVAMDPYSSDGHDGLVKNGKIVNDETLPILGRMSVAQAQAGFDWIGPSDMMDGRIGFIRDCLDVEGYADTGILAYTAKYASAYYGPFRDALESAPKAGDKKTYQMDPANRFEAQIEAELDEMEGADVLMVKPALHYLDVIADLKATSNLPIAAYHVSGECAMLTAACQNGWLDFEKAMPEVLTSIHRAGADMILTYFAKDFAKLHRSGKV